MSDNLEHLLKEVGLLKYRREGLDKLIQERYKVIESLLKKKGLTKYVIGEGKVQVAARVKTLSSYELTATDKLLDVINDPLQFARVILDTSAPTKKLISALKALDVPASLFKKKTGKSFVEVTVGKEHESRKAIAEAQKAALIETEKLRHALSAAVAQKGDEKFLTKPVLKEAKNVS